MGYWYHICTIGRYHKVDLNWVNFFLKLLNVHKLFDVSTFVEMRELVKKSQVLCMLASSPTKISSSEEDLVVRLLTYNESFRITANEAIQHEYFSTIK